MMEAPIENGPAAAWTPTPFVIAPDVAELVGAPSDPPSPDEAEAERLMTPEVRDALRRIFRELAAIQPRDRDIVFGAMRGLHLKAIGDRVGFTKQAASNRLLAMKRRCPKFGAFVEEVMPRLRCRQFTGPDRKRRT